jgi:cytochrome c551/c552
MNRKHGGLAGFALVIGMSAPAVCAQVANAERGQALYENHCVVCHTSRVHTRVNRIAATRAEIRDIVEKWQTQEKLQWGAQEVNDVVEYLNRTRYQF